MDIYFKCYIKDISCELKIYNKTNNQFNFYQLNSKCEISSLKKIFAKIKNNTEIKFYCNLYYESYTRITTHDKFMEIFNENIKKICFIFPFLTHIEIGKSNKDIHLNKNVLTAIKFSKINEYEIINHSNDELIQILKNKNIKKIKVKLYENNDINCEDLKKIILLNVNSFEFIFDFNYSDAIILFDFLLFELIKINKKFLLMIKNNNTLLNNKYFLFYNVKFNVLHNDNNYLNYVNYEPSLYINKKIDSDLFFMYE